MFTVSSIVQHALPFGSLSVSVERMTIGQSLIRATARLTKPGPEGLPQRGDRLGDDLHGIRRISMACQIPVL